ncbi:hypothetical protein SAMN05216275_10553 [Streptosporangium canum]|uniref:Uncharacterized protein n=1 Tax=Streptosporangium canum TaxID=324952 RepID=A0A1I3L8V4_9ACTN|nr:hypothetical protein [Streptosporangium canum]SFI81151.1 hypothetical protein SAMN05216275_10553 [Streptosporangium canum]
MASNDMKARRRIKRRAMARLPKTTGEPIETLVGDQIADALHLVPQDEWERILRLAVVNAFEELNGNRTAKHASLWIEGLEFTDAA